MNKVSIKMPWQPPIELDIDDVNARISSGTLDPSVTLAWKAGMQSWMPLSEFPGIVSRPAPPLLRSESRDLNSIDSPEKCIPSNAKRNSPKQTGNEATDILQKDSRWWTRHRFLVWLAYALFVSTTFASWIAYSFRELVSTSAYSGDIRVNGTIGYTVGHIVGLMILPTAIWILGPVYRFLTKRPFPWFSLSLVSTFILGLEIFLIVRLLPSATAPIPFLLISALVFLAYMKET